MTSSIEAKKPATMMTVRSPDESHTGLLMPAWLLLLFMRRASRFAVLLIGAPLLFLADVAGAAMPIQRWQHPSGAEVYFVESPSIPMVDVEMDFDGGSRRDPVPQVGLADATAGMMSSGVEAWQGKSSLDENSLSEAWIDLGAQFGADASAERFTVSLRSLTDPQLLWPSVDLAAHQLAAPSFDSKVWRRDRERIRASLREAEIRPGTHAQRAFGKAVYQDHPYARYLTEASLDAISPSSMRKFYETHLKACQAKVMMVGAIDRTSAERLADRLLQPLTGRPCDALPSVPEVKLLDAANDIRIPFEAAQAQILMGQPGMRRDDPDFLALYVGNYILGGGGFVSRLMTQVREQRGLTYGVYSYFAPGLHRGAFRIGLTTRPDQAEEALAVSRQVLERFVQEGPTEDELQSAKAFLVNGFALRFDSNRKLLGNVANIAWYGLPLDYLDTWVDRVNQLTTAQIKDAFQRLVRPDRMVTVVVGAKQP